MLLLLLLFCHILRMIRLSTRKLFQLLVSIHRLCWRFLLLLFHLKCSFEEWSWGLCAWIWFALRWVRSCNFTCERKHNLLHQNLRLWSLITSLSTWRSHLIINLRLIIRFLWHWDWACSGIFLSYWILIDCVLLLTYWRLIVLQVHNLKLRLVLVSYLITSIKHSSTCTSFVNRSFWWFLLDVLLFVLIWGFHVIVCAHYSPTAYRGLLNISCLLLRKMF